MSVLPKINMRRTMLIARRDYLGYIKTWGFWISFFLPFIFGALGILFSVMDFDFSPQKYETILDETGIHAPGLQAKLDADNAKIERLAIEGLTETPLFSEEQGAELLQRYDTGGIDAAKAFAEQNLPGIGPQLDKVLDAAKPGFIYLDPPAQTLDGLMPYLKGDAKIEIEGEKVELGGALVIREGEEGAAKIEYWSSNINSRKSINLAEDYFKDRAELAYLESGGLTKDGLKAARKGTTEAEVFNPTKVRGADGTGQEVTQTDRVPYIVSAVLAAVLWLTVFSGAYMLLTSMLEEKLNKLLEMMLASTRFAEIILGKLLGVAALTITAMAPYILIGILSVVAIIFFPPPGMEEVAAGLTQSFTPKLIIFFLIFLVLGYIFYGACFIALGSLSQSMQDAQTLTTPIMFVLMGAVFVVPIGLTAPDSPLLVFASWFPLSSPFAMIMRLPADPPLWQLILSVVLLAVMTFGVILLAGRIFRFGVLSGAGVKVATDWFKRTILRRKTV